MQRSSLKARTREERQNKDAFTRAKRPSLQQVPATYLPRRGGSATGFVTAGSITPETCGSKAPAFPGIFRTHSGIKEPSLVPGILKHRNQRTIAGSGYLKTSKSKNHRWFRVFETMGIKEPSLVRRGGLHCFWCPNKT